LANLHSTGEFLSLLAALLLPSLPILSAGGSISMLVSHPRITALASIAAVGALLPPFKIAILPIPMLRNSLGWGFGHREKILTASPLTRRRRDPSRDIIVDLFRSPDFRVVSTVVRPVSTGRPIGIVEVYGNPFRD
jgi:hypothetical protein